MPVFVFDFDSTLVTVEALDELFARSLDGREDRGPRIAAFQEITDLGMAGEISAAESLSRRLAVLRADRAMIEGVASEVAERITPSVLRHLGFFSENMERIHVVSGGFEELILPSLVRLGIPASRLQAHRFRFDAGGHVIGLDPDTVMARGGKPAALTGLASAGATVWMVGDGATDLEVRELGLVDRFVAFTENCHRDPVVARADHVARSMDELLTLWETA